MSFHSPSHHQTEVSGNHSSSSAIPMSISDNNNNNNNNNHHANNNNHKNDDDHPMAIDSHPSFPPSSSPSFPSPSSPSCVALLIGNGWTESIHENVFLVGRKVFPSSSNPTPSTSPSPSSPRVIRFSSAKNVSREHAKFWYNTSSLNSQHGNGWILQCLSKNGVIVNSSYVDSDVCVALPRGPEPIRIDLAEESFFFVTKETIMSKKMEGEGKGAEALS